jgi:hypothetical protein
VFDVCFEEMHCIHVQVVTFSCQIYIQDKDNMLLRNVGNHSRMTKINITEDTNPHMHSLSFFMQQLLQISKSFITKSEMRSWKQLNIKFYWIFRSSAIYFVIRYVSFQGLYCFHLHSQAVQVCLLWQCWTSWRSTPVLQNIRNYSHNSVTSHKIRSFIYTLC